MKQIEKKLKILIVDDEPDIRERLGSVLDRRGYQVFTADNGFVGLAIASQKNVDIIICDIVMPRMDGFGFLEELRQYTLKAEVIIVTGYPSVDKCKESIAKNALAYLVKPVTINDVLSNIAKAKKRINDKNEMLKESILNFRSKTLPLSRPDFSGLKIENLWKS